MRRETRFCTLILPVSSGVWASGLDTEVFVVRVAMSPLAYARAGVEAASLLVRHRALTLAMARREVSERYAGQMLGALWAIGHPLLLAGVYIFMFVFVFRTRVGDSDAAATTGDYAAYLLSGLIPWLMIVECLNKTTSSIVGQANLVKQVVFPIEVLPVKGVLASMFTQSIFVIVLALYMLLHGGSIPWTFSLAPILMATLGLGMIGIGYVLSSLGVFVRDTRELVQVFSTIGIYLAPVCYFDTMVPERVRWLLQLNPFSHAVWCFHDAMYAGRFDHPVSWIIFPSLSVAAFLVGYRFFRFAKPFFGNAL